uniref:LON peptidase substrate-binding domain-containing protein n=1 Tax=uncultured Treponema sp. TaxID=162155 RepID=UPI0025DEBF80
MKKQSNEKEILGLPAETQLPLKLNILPIGGRFKTLRIFPGIFTPLMINNSEDIKVIEDSLAGDGFIGIVMLKEDKENPTVVDLHKVGTVARIIKKINLPDGGVNVFVSTLQRFKIRKVLNSSNPIVAAVEYLEDEEDNTFEVK